MNPTPNALNMKVVRERLERLVADLATNEGEAATLQTSLEKVERMITVVRSITAKTDLLALNASIEAARAGHSGKGFAVVAHEVARLAEKSQESIQNVDAVISSLKESVLVMTAKLDRLQRSLDDMLGDLTPVAAKPKPEAA